MIKEQGLSLMQVCKDMDRAPGVVRCWVPQFESDKELLKKASALFARS